MAAISVTATSVLPGTGAQIEYGLLGATVTAGQSLYYDSSSSSYKLADANDTTATATFRGVALNGGVSGQPVAVQTGGLITIGATVVAGEIYVLGATAGAIYPADDLASGWYTSIIGVAATTGSIYINRFNSGYAT